MAQRASGIVVIGAVLAGTGGLAQGQSEWQATSQHLVWRADAGYLSSVMPDGRSAIVSIKGQLVQHDFASGAERKLTDLGADDRALGATAISTDGRQIAFLVRHQKTRLQLWIASLSDTNTTPSRVLLDRDGENWTSPEGWSPDGRSIAVSLDEGKAGQIRLALLSTADGSMRILKTVPRNGVWTYHMRFSRDGRRVAIEQPDAAGGRDIAVLAIDSAKEFLVAPGPSDDELIDWSPDGREIVYRSDRKGPAALWAVPVGDRSAGEPALISANLGNFEPVGLNAAGAFYYRPIRPRDRVSVAAFDPATSAVVTSLPDGGPAFVGAASLPVWSQDGRSIAYISDQRGLGGRQRLIVHNVLTQLRWEIAPQVPVFGLFFGHLRWSPDGGSVAWVSDYTYTGSRIYRIGLDSGAATLTASTDQWYSFADSTPEYSVLRLWSRDNKMYFDRGVGNGSKDMAVIEVDPATGKEREIFRGPDGWVDRLAVAPDGDVVYFARPAGQAKASPQDLVARDVKSGTERVLASALFLQGMHLSPDGRWLLVQHKRDPADTASVNSVVPTTGGGARELPGAMSYRIWTADSRAFIGQTGSGREGLRYWLVPADGSPARPIDALGTDFLEISLSPNGRFIAYIQSDRTAAPSEIWVMELRAQTGTPRTDGLKKTSDPVTWSIALAPNARAVAGEAVDAVITAKIDTDWHVYSMTQAPNGPSALLVDVPAGQSFTRAGAIVESKPITQFDPSFNIETRFFEKAATLTVPVRVVLGTPPGPHTLRIAVDYQICSSRMCLPPATVELKVSVPVGGLAR